MNASDRPFGTTGAEAEARSSGDVVVDEGEGHQRVIEFLEQLKVL